MSASDHLSRLSPALLERADPVRAVQMKAYLRGQFEFFGIGTPARRELLKSIAHRHLPAEQVLELAGALWALPQREFQYCAVDLLQWHRKGLTLKDLPLLKRLLESKSWWETVDGLSAVIGKVVRQARENDPSSQAVMDLWLTDRNFWVQRCAMIHQLGWRLDTDEERLFRYALHLSAEPEFFIRKAIGWALRDYARWQPEAVRNFLYPNKDRFSALTFREAAKHIDMR